MKLTKGQIIVRGHRGLELGVTTPLAKAVAVDDASHKCVSVAPTLEQMLSAFDPKKHGGEALAGRPVGSEICV